MRFRSAIFLGFLACMARDGSAQTVDTSRRLTVASVTGAVLDSTTRSRLPGAMVQLVDAEDIKRFGRTVTADSLGHFELNGVPDGRYFLGFYHPLLDSLGIEPTVREVLISAGRSVYLDIATPSPMHLKARICGGHGAESGSLVIGVVRDIRTHTPISGAAVTGSWLEVDVRRNGLIPRQKNLSTTTAANGWFALCNAPAPGSLRLLAVRDADSTDVIEVQVPPEGFLRRELYLTALQVTADAHPEVVQSSVALVSPPSTRMRVGQLHGTIVSADGFPLANARVRLAGGPQAQTNERGEWALTGAALGTRMLEVGAIGYYPDRRAVDVETNTPGLRIALSTLRAVLDTVRVTAQGVHANEIKGFNDRRRTGTGRYLTADDIMRRKPLVVSELFRNMPGVEIRYTAGGFEGRILLRGNMLGECTPAIFLDGARISGSDGYAIPGITLDDLDGWVRPHEVLGIEVYAGPGAPVQFQQGARESLKSKGETVAATEKNDDSNCGSIVIWRK